LRWRSKTILSGTVKTLEQDLGARLFSRTTRNVELAEAGHVFVAEAGRLIAQNERVIALVRQSSRDIARPLGALIAKAREEPSLPVDIRFVSSEAAHLQEGLAKGTLQAAFFAGRLCDANLPDLRTARLFRDNLAVLLSSSHPLARSPLPSFDHLNRSSGSAARPVLSFGS
jgi:DNA-binding transcriptional LysR family regulator